MKLKFDEIRVAQIWPRPSPLMLRWFYVGTWWAAHVAPSLRAPVGQLLGLGAPVQPHWWSRNHNQTELEGPNRPKTTY